MADVPSERNGLRTNGWSGGRNVPGFVNYVRCGRKSAAVPKTNDAATINSVTLYTLLVRSDGR